MDKELVAHIVELVKMELRNTAILGERQLMAWRESVGPTRRSSGEGTWTERARRRQRMARGLATPVGANGSKLSGGQSRRLALARALSKQAQVFVLDEPTTGLDVETERRLMARLRDRKTTAIVASSSPGVLRYADLVVHLSGGTVQAVGSVAELRESSEEFRRLLDGADQH